LEGPSAITFGRSRACQHGQCGFNPPIYFGWSPTPSLVLEGLGQPTVMILSPYTIDGDPPYIPLLADLLVRDVFI
jgi:hypothetical protein